MEIAVLGTRGIDPNDADKRYTLKTLSGEYSGPKLLCLMFVAFKTVAPDRDIGFDVARVPGSRRDAHGPEREVGVVKWRWKPLGCATAPAS